MEIGKLKSILESLLFVSGEPIKIIKLAKIIGIKDIEIETAINQIQKEDAGNRGMIIIRKEGLVQMVTNPQNAKIAKELVKGEIQSSLSKASLEVLSIIAYRGPLSRIDVEAVRGVNCSFTIRALLMRGLIERTSNPTNNRSYLYKISFEFLKKLGIETVEKLPDWEKLSQNPQVEDLVENK